MTISIYSILIWTISLMVAGLTILTYISTQKVSGRSFGFCIFCVCIWMTGIGFLISANNYEIATFLNRFIYFICSLIATSFLYFFFTLPKDNPPTKHILILLAILEIILFYLFFFTNLMVHDVFKLDSISAWGWHFGTLSFLFEIFFLVSFVIGLTKMFNEYKKCKDVSSKNHIKYLFLIILFGSIPPFFISIIFPQLGYFDLNWLGPISTIFWISIMTYSIIQHRLFNIKIITIEIAIFMLWIILLIRICSMEDIHSIIEEICLLIISIVFGILLIRGTLHEIDQNEHFERLTDELHRAYIELQKKN